MPRQRGIHNKPYETKKEIIRFLLNAPSGMSEEPSIRDYLREKFDISEQKNIKIHLKELQKAGCIEKKGTPGLANIWLVNDIKQIKQIAEKYPSLISDLQKNSKVLTLLRRELPFFKDVGDNYGDLNDLGGMLYTESVNDLRTIVMMKCELSQTFFKNYLLDESYFESFLEIWREINRENDEFKTLTPQALEEIYDAMFLHAVITDKLDGFLNPNAIDEIRQSPIPSRF